MVLNIASLIIDAAMENESIYTLSHTLNTLRIDIVCLRATHYDRIGAQKIGGYLIFYGDCNALYQLTMKIRKGIKRKSKSLTKPELEFL